MTPQPKVAIIDQLSRNKHGKPHEAYRYEDPARHLHADYSQRCRDWKHRLQCCAYAFGGVVSALGASNTVRDHFPTWTNPNYNYESGLGLDMSCLVGFATSTALFYSLHNHEGSKGDENEGFDNQDAWLICGILCGTVGGVWAGYELQDTLFQVLPWTIMASLWLNSTV